MLIRCEEMIRKFIPALKIAVAKELKERGLKQIEIANILGLTQAAISKYFAEKYSKEVKRIEKEKELKIIARKMVESMFKERKDMGIIICKYCHQLNFKKGMCKGF